METAINKAKEIVSLYPLVVFSLSFEKNVFLSSQQDLLSLLQEGEAIVDTTRSKFEVLELNEMSDGGEIQSALSEWTGQSTVPSVFIKGKHIGGCDKVMETNKQGKLVPLLTEAGALTKISSKL